MKFAFWSVIALIAWFTLGALSTSGSMKKGFLPMNDMLILDWLRNSAASEPLVLLWFIVFCLIGGMVTLSFIFCTSTTLLRPIRLASCTAKAFILFSIHLVFILIVILHVISMVAGVKAGYLKAYEMSSFQVGSGYRVKVADIQFVANSSLLKDKADHAKIRYTRENFDPKMNYAVVQVFYHDQLREQGKIGYMNPLVVDQLRITLERFFFDTKSSIPRYGVRLTVARNPVLLPFFVFYGLAAILILLYAIVTWRSPGKVWTEELIDAENND
jgi:hypothetical protein